MTKFDDLLVGYRAGDKTSIEQFKNLFKYLNDREITIIRLFYGIDCSSQSVNEICDYLGLKEDQINQLIQKTTAKCVMVIETYLTPEISDDFKKNQDNLNTLLKYLPAFNELKKIKKFAGPLSRYSKYTLGKFIAEYNHSSGMKGKEVYDKLIEELAPDMIIKEPVESDKEPLNTVFPSTFDEKDPLGVSYKKMVSELISYLEATSYIGKNKNRAAIANLFLDKHKTPNEIKKATGLSMPTIKDNFIIPLFNEGCVDEITLNSSFLETVDNYFKTIFYSSLQKVKDDIHLDDKDLLCFLWVFGADVYEKREYYQKPIVIHKGDKLRVEECIYRVFNVLSEEIVPISKGHLISKLESIISPEKWLPEYVEYILSTNDSILRDTSGLLYLSDNMLDNITSRICRIIYNSPNQTASRDYVLTEYKRLYQDKPSAFRYKEMEKKHFYTISDGVYKYAADKKKPQSVHDFIDNYITTKVLFRWSELLGEIVKINPLINEKSERAYTTNKCATCVSDSDILVLKGHESEYPQYQWNKKRKMDKTNFFINQAVAILRGQPGNEMTYRDFLRQLNDIVRKNGYSDHTVGTVITQYTNEDPKLFIKEDQNIKLDTIVLADVALDYIGLGYKYTDFYRSIYALAISELKSKTEYKMLRSELAVLAATQISDEIDGRIVNKAFADRGKPELLLVDGRGKDTYICLDMAKLASEVAQDKQYKVSPADDNNQNEAAPTMVVDTTPRLDTSYRQLFNWSDITSMLKKDLKHYDKPYFYPGISSDDVLEKFHKFMCQSTNVYLNTLIPQAYYELSYANVDRWSSYDYRSKIARAFESLLVDIFYQNKGVESQTKGLYEIMDLAFPDYLNARKNYDRTGFNGVLNEIYNDRIRFAHPTTSELPTLLNNIKSFISYMALYVYTVAKYYKK